MLWRWEEEKTRSRVRISLAHERVHILFFYSWHYGKTNKSENLNNIFRERNRGETRYCVLSIDGFGTKRTQKTGGKLREITEVILFCKQKNLLTNCDLIKKMGGREEVGFARKKVKFMKINGFLRKKVEKWHKFKFIGTLLHFET